MNKRLVGSNGEELAVDFLMKHGLRILEKNYTTKIGEIDIIAVDGETTVFIEVKLRRTDGMGRPYESVNGGKQSKILRVAMLYAQKARIYERPMRFDVIEVMGGEIIWQKNAFQMTTNQFRYL